MTISIRHNPSDQETDQAIEYLQKANLGYLMPGELEWTLGLDRVSQQFPMLIPEGLRGILS